MIKLHPLRDLLDVILQDCVPADLKALGWKYQDFNTKFTQDAWDYMLRMIGHGEYQILIMSRSKDPKDPWVRGQLLISPQGYVNLGNEERRKEIPWGTH